jgi:hypothetical protein
MTTFAFVHSPLVGTVTWHPLVAALQAQGHTTISATLEDPADGETTWWQTHLTTAVQSLAGLPSPYVLVGHSGAGALLPLIANALSQPPSAYLYVDAGVLWQPASRLDMLYTENSHTTQAEAFEVFLKEGGRFPEWTDEQLRDLVAADDLRHALVASLRPKPLSFFTEVIPVPAQWEQVPCAYLQLSPTYQSYADAAAAKGWLVERIPTHHFAMLSNAPLIAETMIQMVRRLGV